MTLPGRDWLIAAAALDGIAALLHLGCIVGGPQWYRFFGAGEAIVRLAEYGSWRPTIFALLIAGILSVWGLFALSGAGLIGRLPLLRTALAAITLVYLARAAALPVMLATMHDRSSTFLWWSSLIVLGYGVVHGIGLFRAWPSLSAR